MTPEQSKIAKDYTKKIEKAHAEYKSEKIEIEEFDDRIFKARCIFKTLWRRSKQHI